MFAQLGDIKFELITYFNGLNESVSYNYAQHERIENKPILQFLGKNLLEEDIRLNFHRSFCVPEDEIKLLTDAADDAKPLKFIKGNGEYLRAFVITEIQKTTEQTTPEGDIISIQIDLRLREYTGTVPDDEEDEDKGFKTKS